MLRQLFSLDTQSGGKFPESSRMRVDLPGLNVDDSLLGDLGSLRQLTLRQDFCLTQLAEPHDNGQLIRSRCKTIADTRRSYIASIAILY